VKKEVAKTDLEIIAFCNSFLHLFDSNTYNIEKIVEHFPNRRFLKIAWVLS
jgi:hypothetical protein